MNITYRMVSFRHAMAFFVLLSLSVLIPGRSHAAEVQDAPVAIPATSAAIWQAIDREIAALDKVIATGKLEAAHHHAFAVRDLVNALPSKSTALKAAQLTQIKSGGKFVSTLAARIDASGDANNKSETAANVQKLKDQLKAIRANYK